MKVLNNVVAASFVLGLASSRLVADTEFGDDIPTEVVEQFIGLNFGAEPRLYSDIFDAFPDFAVPAGFDVVASADQGITQRVILRTELDDAAAHAALVAAFVAEGWMEMPAYGASAPRTGFVSAETPMQNSGLCNDQLGRMSITVGSGEEGTGEGSKYVNLAHTVSSAFGGLRRSCEQEAELMTQRLDTRRRGGMEIMQYVPALVLPEQDVANAMARVGFAGGGGGSSNDYETRGNLAITWSGDRLMDHFAPQVLEQGWQPDAQVSGAQAAFGSWTKTVDGNEFLGTLTLVQTAADYWDLKFRIVRTGGTAANGLFSR